MRIQIAPGSSPGDFVDYVLRLGCTVKWLDDKTVEVRVTHPETVEDEPGSLMEWCRAWLDSPRGRGRALEFVTGAGDVPRVRSRALEIAPAS
jgi:hypothetical protein